MANHAVLAIRPKSYSTPGHAENEKQKSVLPHLREAYSQRAVVKNLRLSREVYQSDFRKTNSNGSGEPYLGKEREAEDVR